MFENVIAYQAKQRPHALAIMTPAGNATYAKFDADIDRIGARLLEIDGLGGRIAIQTKNPSLHWLALLALTRLNMLTLSLPPAADRPEADLLAILKPDFILSDRETPVPGYKSFFMSPQWVQDALSGPAAVLPKRSYSPEDPVRVTTSSGTTGVPKKILYKRKHVDSRLKYGSLVIPIAEIRALITMGLDHSGGYVSALLCWLNGGTVVYPAPNFQWVDVLPMLAPGGLTCAPAQLEVMMRALPTTFPPLQSFTCVVAGSVLSQSLSVKARSRLTPNLWVTYASSEAGFTALARASQLEGREGAVGYVVPWADVEIVDKSGHALASGQTGEIRVRSDEIVDGYLEDDDESESAFRDGWFYPGDLGSLSVDGMLTIEGRTNEVMNFGGEKVSPLPIEEALTACAGVRDAVAFAVPGPGGVSIPFAAVVTEAGFDREAAIGKLRALFPRLAIQIVETASIPRNAMGKIQREAVRDNVLVKLIEMQAAGTLPAS
jgi:2,3-dihydroxybenzoate-AMP ligase